MSALSASIAAAVSSLFRRKSQKDESARCSFRSYIHQLRLARAKRELLGSVKSIQQIAESCGYSNAKFFSTVFLKQEGVTPSAYRNLYGGLHQNNA